MAFEIKGKIYRIFPIEKKTESFQTRDLVLETQENYPQLIRFQMVQDNCAQLDNLQEGIEVNVKFDLKGREWNGKFITNLQAWKVEAVSSGTGSAAPAADQGFHPEGMGADLDMDPDNDLPF
jgi:single-strand DNA-binding protein